MLFRSLVRGTMAALGEIEIVISGGVRINASNIDQINKLNPQDNYTFSNICPPKGLNIPVIREIVMGLLGADRTSELDDANSSLFADLMMKAKAMEEAVVMLQHKIQGGYIFANDIEIISPNEAHDFDTELVRLKGICNQMQRYNTKAKIRNIDWPLDVVRKAMTETKSKLHSTEALLKELKSFEGKISYLRTALNNVNDDALRTDIKIVRAHV